MERLRDQTVSRVQEHIAQRQQKQQGEWKATLQGLTDARKLYDAEIRVNVYMPRVHDYLRELENQQKFEFDDGSSERFDIGEKLKERIRPILVKQLIRTPEITDEQIERRIEVLVDRFIVAFVEE